MAHCTAKLWVLFLILLMLLYMACVSSSRFGDVCPICVGTGKCNYCFGRGYVSGEKCYSCNGTGKCRACGGSGILARQIWP